MRIRECLAVFVIVSGLVAFTGYLAYGLGKWVAYYNDSWMHLGDR